MWLPHFGAKDGQLHCISTCLRVARYKYLPILKRKIWDEKGLVVAGPQNGIGIFSAPLYLISVSCTPDFEFEKWPEGSVPPRFASGESHWT